MCTVLRICASGLAFRVPNTTRTHTLPHLFRRLVSGQNWPGPQNPDLGGRGPSSPDMPSDPLRGS
eukprot:9474832-Alexandrium_andersonii.AAC.1